jgi:serine phosphatase RsbU (regulator of sigma subunit)
VSLHAGIDYRSVFDVSPTAAVLLSPDRFVILDANAAYERAVGVPRAVLVGTALLDAFPAGPEQVAGAEVAGRVRGSLERVKRTGRADALPPLRYDLRDPATGRYVRRYWTMLTVPVLGADGRLAQLLHKVEDITPFVSGHPATPAGTGAGSSAGTGAETVAAAVADGPAALDGDALTGDVLQRAHELREAFLRMREAAERERQMALVLQESLLTPPPPSEDLRIVVRYHAAAAGSAVGGDWYDAYLQPDGSTVLAVGDVTGHDVTAAAQMGQLRALIRAVGYDSGAGPAQTLARADRTAAGLALDTMATAVVAHVARPSPADADAGRVVRWSNAGHPPPAVLRADGSVDVLRAPSEPLLGVLPDGPRTDHSTVLHDGDTLVLYTDGLVERRGRDPDVGLALLAQALDGHQHDGLEVLCEAVLTALGARDHDDDVVLVAVRPHAAPSG